MSLGAWQESRAELASILANGSLDERTQSRAMFLLAACDDKLGRWSDAAVGYDKVASRMPLLEDYSRYYAARAYYFAHDLAKASERAAAVSSKSVLDAERRLLEGDILRAQSRWREVATLYERYLQDYPNGIRHTEASFRLAEAYEHAGKKIPDALKLYRQLIFDAPLSRFAAEAKARTAALLASLPARDRAPYETTTELEHISRGRAFFDAMRNPESEAEFAAALDASELTPALACEASYLRAQSVFKQRQRARSAPLFAQAVEECKKAENPDLQVKAAYQAGRAYGNVGGQDGAEKAIAFFRLAETLHPEHSFSDDACLRQAEIWMTLEKQGVPGASERIVSLLSDLPELFPDGDMRAEALWRLAWRAYRAKDYRLAIQLLDREIAVVPHDFNYWAEGQPHYWKARALDELGERRQALATYESCVREYPLGYYSFLSLNRIREIDDKELARVLAEIDRASDRASGSAELQFSPRSTYGEPGFLRAIELLRLGLGREAERELARQGLRVPEGKSRESDPEKAERLWATALLYHRAGRHDKSHWIARWFVPDYRLAWPTKTARQRWDIAYPKAWWHLLEPAARQHGYPVALLGAIVREESAFDPTLESFANAIGLTQMIFPTARRFGKGLGFEINRDTLRDPDRNVAIGSRFLAFLFQTFAGEAGLLVPAYNAGEHAVWRWLCERGHRHLDELIEEIPYDETRLYSKRVLSSYFAYSYLESGEVPVVRREIPDAAIARGSKCRPAKATKSAKPAKPAKTANPTKTAESSKDRQGATKATKAKKRTGAAGK
ncbi:MAG: lytic transglycosylase domain-containing protein [Pseudomonadota bacterium]